MLPGAFEFGPTLSLHPRSDRSVTNQKTEKTLRRILQNEGHALNTLRKYGETGVDILAPRRRTKLFIEVIGHKSRAPARSKDFYESFFRAVSRVNEAAARCIIAMPSLVARGLPQRARHYGGAWKRIGESFPELEIWPVDTKAKTFSATRWNDWLKLA